MSFPIEEKYQEIINSLQQGGLPKVSLSIKDWDQILADLENYPELEASAQLKWLCLLDHSYPIEPRLAPFLIVMLGAKQTPEEHIPFLLGISTKHIIQERKRAGEKIPLDLLKVLRKHLFSTSLETVEWTLRTLLELGQQGRVLEEDVLKIRPHFFQSLHLKYNRIRKISDELLKLWSSGPHEFQK